MAEVQHQLTPNVTQDMGAISSSGPSKTLDGLDERNKLIEKARNQRILVPDLLSVMPTFPSNIHPEVDKVNNQIDEWLKTVNVEEGKKAKHRTYGDYTLLAAVYYPDCPADELLVLSRFLYWIFIFDDDIDTGGHLTNDRQGTLLCCAEARECIDACLGPDPSYSPPPNSRGSVEMLYPILKDFRAGLGPITVERLRLDLHGYVDAVSKQQASRQGDLPDPWELLKVRCYDIATRPSITQVEFALSFELPEDIRRHEAIEAIIVGCTKLCVLVNELLSLQKEFRDSQIENICLLFTNTYDLSLQGAIDKVLDIVREEYEFCVEAESRLPWSKDNKELNRMIQEYVWVCQRMATGTAYWSYNCGRYFDISQFKGEREVLLDLSDV